MSSPSNQNQQQQQNSSPTNYTPFEAVLGLVVIVAVGYGIYYYMQQVADEARKKTPDAKTPDAKTTTVTPGTTTAVPTTTPEPLAAFTFTSPASLFVAIQSGLAVLIMFITNLVGRESKTAGILVIIYVLLVIVGAIVAAIAGYWQLWAMWSGSLLLSFLTIRSAREFVAGGFIKSKGPLNAAFVYLGDMLKAIGKMVTGAENQAQKTDKDIQNLV